MFLLEKHETNREYICPHASIQAALCPDIMSLLCNTDFCLDESYDLKTSRSVYILPAPLCPRDTRERTLRWKESISKKCSRRRRKDKVLTFVRSAIITHWCCFAPQGSLDNISIILLCFPGAPQLSAEALHQEAELEDLLESKVAGEWLKEVVLSIKLLSLLSKGGQYVCESVSY